MRCAIMQPTYLPWSGFFDLIDSVDVFVFLDNVKLEKSSWHVRNQIKSAQGAMMLTVPVSTPNGRLETMINETLLSTKPWQKKHLKSLITNYSKAPFFNEVYPVVETILQQPFDNLAQLNITLIKTLCKQLSITTPLVTASEMASITGVKDERLVSICQQLGANHYLSPVGAADYIEKNTKGGALTKANIKLSYQRYQAPIYPQLYGEFVSHLSIFDALFNCGFINTLKLIRENSDRSELI
ncbi:WbqC family protein [Thalassotalea eurytherma]|uniref:WbqC family protein n=1 Tax=Thalassotalea eurytherma TaxID=1144278 RepID=A0ABQ6H4Q0_9GAMM|nr:WbqC family protein [Thalassotalea eurytherma]GLX83130.1 hypothetical protein theurythT_25820 [Thalassotalea eurytherma]